MKKILIISCVFPPEPVVSAQLSFDIANKLAEDHEVTVLSPAPTRPENFQFEKVKKEYAFQHCITDSFTSPQSRLIPRMRESYSFGKACENYIRKNHSDIDGIYINSWPLFSQYFIIRVAKKFGIPTIIHIQDIYPESLINKLPVAKKAFFNMLLPMDRYILKNAKSILCISENMLKTLSEVRGIAKEKFTVVANWQNEENFTEYQKSKTGNSKSDLFTFMYLGNNGPVAGVELLIEAFADADIPNSRLVIAGSGSRTQACKELAGKFPNSKIEFIPVPDGKVPETQDMADVMLLPVKTGAAMSSIPSKLPAYMFSQKPIIGSLDLESDTAKAIIDSGCGIVVEPENKKQLSESMTEIAGWDDEQLIRNGKKGFDYAMTYLSKKSNLQKVMETILQGV